MCRDDYDKLLMLDYWKYNNAPDEKDILYQKEMMEKNRELVARYMKMAPTWVDALLEY